jgi:hypothetical protein
MKRLLLIVLVSCSGQTQLPKGPPPEYEDEPMATQRDAAPAAPAVDAGATE